MIVGIGSDIVHIARIEKSLERHGESFMQRVLHERELRELQENYPVEKYKNFVAKRFSVKEAASKAIGTGIAKGVSWQDFYVVHDENGKPLLKLLGKAKEYADNMGVCSIHVTISDEREYAVAFVVLEA